MNEDTEVFRSCSATLHGELFVFGGYASTMNKRKQVSALNFSFHLLEKRLKNDKKVSKLVGCELKRIGDLSYEFCKGACGTYSLPEERIFLCFSNEARTKCERLFKWYVK